MYSIVKQGDMVLKDGQPLGLHFLMFIPALIGQGTKEQQEKWLPRAYNLDIIGTYAQVMKYFIWKFVVIDIKPNNNNKSGFLNSLN